MRTTVFQKLFLAAVFLVQALACNGGGVDPATESEEVATGSDIATHGHVPTFDEFRKTVYRRPGDNVYIVNGDETIDSDEKLFDFWRGLYWNNGALTLSTLQHGGVGDQWDATAKRKLTYCIGKSVPADKKAALVEALRQASDLGWEKYGDVDFTYLPAEDSNCTAANSKIKFQVNYVTSTNPDLLATAFFPSAAPLGYQLQVYPPAFTSPENPLASIMTHELGHILGFRHEFTRPEAGVCFENSDWRAITAYDSDSIMQYYGRCNSLNGGRTLSAKDKDGVALVYGPASGYIAPSPARIKPWGNRSLNATGTFPSDSARMIQVASFNSALGTQFTSRLSGTGNFDLYVRYGSPPTLTAYDCRPLAPSSAEECSMASRNATAYVAVVATVGGTMSLSTTWTDGKTTVQSIPVVLNGSVVDTNIKYATVIAGSQLLVRPAFDTKNGAGAFFYVDLGPSPIVRINCNDIGGNQCGITVPPGKTYASVVLTQSRYSLPAQTTSVEVTWTSPIPAPPTCNIDIPLTGSTIDDFTATISSNATSCTLDLDGKNLGGVPCNSSKVFSGLTVGDHLLTLKPVTSSSMTLCQKKFTVTEDPLTCNVDISPDHGTPSTWFLATWTSNGTGCGWQYDSPLNGMMLRDCNYGDWVANNPIGIHKVILTTHLGTRTKTCEKSFMVGDVAPVCSSISMNRTSGTSADDFLLSYSTTGTSCPMTYDGSPYIYGGACSGTNMVMPKSVGNHTVKIKVTNSLGTAPADCQINYTVNPSCTIKVLPTWGTVAENTQFTATWTTDGDTCNYSLNSVNQGAVSPCLGTVSKKLSASDLVAKFGTGNVTVGLQPSLATFKGSCASAPIWVGTSGLPPW